MERFLRYILWFLLPALLLVSTYVILDPFRVLWPIGDERSSYIASSDDYYGVERYLKNKSLGYQYNTFLFGNSKVMAYQEEAVCWGDLNCRFYNFGAPGESLLNIKKKIELIQAKGDDIKKAYIILDHKILMNERNKHPNFQGPVYEHHPLVSDNSWISFHAAFLQYYLKDAFLVSHLVHKLGGTWHEWMKGHFADPNKFKFNPYDIVTNQVSNENKEAFPDKRFRSQKSISIPELTIGQKEKLKRLAELIHNLNGKVWVIIGPTSTQRNVSEKLLEDLVAIFGKDRVLVAKNKLELEEGLWYDDSHYSNLWGNIMLKSLRRSNNQKP